MSSTQLAHVDGPPLERAGQMIWIGDLPALGAVRCPDQAAIIFADQSRQLSYAELDRACDGFVALLRARNIRSGDRVAYLGKNSELYFPVLLGAVRAGVVVVPLNWRLTPVELAYQLQDSQSCLLIHDRELTDAAVQSRELCNRALPLLPTDARTGGDSLISALSKPAERTVAPRDRSQVLLQLYTSGTTGKPKGVLVSHYALSIMRHAELISPDFAHLRAGSVILSAMPNFHVGGMSWVLMGLVRFGTVVLTADAAPSSLLALLRRFDAEHTFAVPTVIRAIVDELHSRGESPPALAGIFYGAMPMSESLLREALQLFNCAFVQFFGMTEIAGSATFLAPQDHDPARPQLLRTVGKPYPGTSLEIRGPDRRVLPRNTHGEIWIKSPSLMLGYNQLPDQTAQAIVDGWYASGDGGFVDDEGYLNLTDRIKDMIISGGENIYPAEVEEALRRHPSVLDAAVVAMPDARWGEMVAAAVELRPGKQVSPAELQSFARNQIAGYKCPKRVIFMEVLPRTVSGKVQRAEVRRRMREEVSGK